MEKSSLPRIHSMDSMRGLASLQVLLHHSLCITVGFYTAYIAPSPSENSILIDTFTFSPLHFLWAGHEAVIFFFVMSGFVLSIPYYKERGDKYPSFIIKRIFRIYLPYLIALGVGFLLNSIYNSHPRIPELSEWFNGIFARAVTPSEYVDFVFFLKGYFHNVVTSLWSLPVEIKLSLLIPIITIPLRKLNRNICIFFPIFNMLIYHFGKRLGMESIWPDFTLFYYFTFFLFGAVLSRYFQEIMAIFNNFSQVALVVMLIISILFYTYKWNITLLSNHLYIYFHKIPADYMTAVASLLILILGMTTRFSRILNTKYLIGLGRISFSLYLVHPLIIAFVGFTLGQIIHVYYLVPLAIVLSLIASIPFHYLIESPLQKLGRKLGEKLVRI